MLDETKATEVLWSEMSERERLAFLAGFLCGEGTFTIGNSEYCSPMIAACNTDITCIELLALHFGGNVTERTRYKNWKQSYGWSIAGKKVKAVIEALEPFLLMKRKSAKLLMQLAETLGKTSRLDVKEEVRSFRYDLADQVRACNKKGSSDVD